MRSDESDLSYLLAGRGRVSVIGPERGPARVRPNQITRFESPHGSVRYVYADAQGVIVSALQVMTRDGVHATIANVFTDPDARRQKLAARLLARARKDFDSVTHSVHLSEAGRGWKGAVGDERRRRSRRRVVRSGR